MLWHVSLIFFLCVVHFFSTKAALDSVLRLVSFSVAAQSDLFIRYSLSNMMFTFKDLKLGCYKNFATLFLFLKKVLKFFMGEKIVLRNNFTTFQGPVHLAESFTEKTRLTSFHIYFLSFPVHCHANFVLFAGYLWNGHPLGTRNIREPHPTYDSAHNESLNYDIRVSTIYRHASFDPGERGVRSNRCLPLPPFNGLFSALNTISSIKFDFTTSNGRIARCSVDQ